MGSKSYLCLNVGSCLIVYRKYCIYFLFPMKYHRLSVELESRRAVPQLISGGGMPRTKLAHDFSTPIL